LNRITLLISATAVIGLLFIGFMLLPDTADVTDVINASNCRQNLENVFERLVRYAKTHAEFPTDQDGSLDLQKIHDALEIATDEQCLCTTNPTFDCYVFRHGLRPEDLIEEWQTEIPWSIIAMDAIGNHPISDGANVGSHRVNVLFSCAHSSSSLILSLIEYELFQEKLKNGEQFDNTILGVNQ